MVRTSIPYKFNAKCTLFFTTQFLLLFKNMGYLSMKCLSVWLFLLATSLAEKGKGETCSFTFFSSLARLMPCRPSVAPFRPIPPTVACCNAIKTLGQPCLCVLVNGPPITGVDRELAMLLPQKCTANFDPCTLSQSLS